MSYKIVILFFVIALTTTGYSATNMTCKPKKMSANGNGKIEFKLTKCSNSSYDDKWVKLTIRQSKLAVGFLNLAIKNGNKINIGVVNEESGFLLLDYLTTDTISGK